MSIVLLAAGTGPGAHVLDSLARQKAPASTFEVLWLGGRVTDPRAGPQHGAPIDRRVPIPRPRDESPAAEALAYNAGLVAARGKVVAFCGPDSTLPESFVEAVIAVFERQPRSVLHAFDEAQVLGARRVDLIAIGGAEEGYGDCADCCTACELSLRLIHLGCQPEVLPGDPISRPGTRAASTGIRFLGPHPTRSCAGVVLRAGARPRLLPREENPGVRVLREAAVRPFHCVAPIDLAAPEIPPRDLKQAGRPSQIALTAGKADSVRTRWRTLADAASYARLLFRTTGLEHPDRPQDDSSPPASGGRQALASFGAKAGHAVSRAGLGIRVIRRIHAENRETLDLARVCLQKLAAEGVREARVWGTDLAEAALRRGGPRAGVRIGGAQTSGGPATLVAHRDHRVVIASRHGLEHRLRWLQAAGVPSRAIRLLDPAMLERSRCTIPGAGELDPDPSIDLSIVLPTRGRPHLALALLEQIRDTAARPERIEILVCVDQDDRPSHSIDLPGLDVQRIVVPRTTMGALTEAAVRASRGRRILLFNDDVRIATRGWDERIAAEFDRFPDGIALVYANDLHQRAANATFPIVSRSALREIGAIASPLLRHYHIESHLHQIFLHLRARGHDRLVFLEDVVFDHFHPQPDDEGGRPEHPQTYQGRDDRATFSLLEEERRAAADRLALRISEGVAGAPGGHRRRDQREAPPDLSIILVGGPGAASLSGVAGRPADPGCSHELWMTQTSAGDLGEALQRAADRARGAALVFLPWWTEVAAGWGERAALQLRGDSGTAAVYGRRVDPRTGRVCRSQMALFELDEGPVLLEMGRGWPAERNAAAPHPCAAAGLYGLVLDRSMLSAVGGLGTGLSSDLSLGLELCLRLARQGFSVRQDADLVWWGCEPEAPGLRDDLEHIAAAFPAALQAARGPFPQQDRARDTDDLILDPAHGPATPVPEARDA